LVPAGSIVSLPDGKTVKLEQDSTIINIKEKEILVRNDELWGSDRQALDTLNQQVIELKNDQVLSGKQLELQKQAIDLEKQKGDLEHQRAEFYKEQLETVSKVNKDTINQLNELVKTSQPSFFSRVVNTCGWVGGVLAIGLIIGLAL
jgi:hypothetical protein